ncbi:MAG: oligosaccharide flippase family protein [Pseudomonadota bacterium]
MSGAQDHNVVGMRGRSFFVNVGSLVGARGILVLSQILILPILARLLTVDDFALMAMAMSIVVFCSVLSDAGLGRSLIRSKTLDEDEWSSVFWLLIGVGIALGLIILAISPMWAYFFERQELAPMLAALAFVPFMQSAAAVPNAEIERREGHQALAFVQVVSTLVSVTVALGLAFAGAGVWALIGQQLALIGARWLGILWFSRFWPRLTFSRHLLTKHVGFAFDAILVAVVSAVRTQATVIAVGKVLGETALGLFSMSQRFTRLPQFGLAGPMSTVVYVRMAQVQDEPERLVAVYLAALRLLSVILFPALLLVAVAGESIFTILLSERWSAVAPIFALSIAGLTLEGASNVMLACLFRAAGRTDLNVRLTLESAAIQIVFVAIAVFISLEAVAVALSLWGCSVVPRGWVLAKRIVPLAIADCVWAVLPPIFVGLLFVALHVIVVQLLELSMLAELVAAILGCVVAIGVSVGITKAKFVGALRLFRE